MTAEYKHFEQEDTTSEFISLTQRLIIAEKVKVMKMLKNDEEIVDAKLAFYDPITGHCQIDWYIKKKDVDAPFEVLESKING
jgi:hypothetical protein